MYRFCSEVYGALGTLIFSTPPPPTVFKYFPKKQHFSKKKNVPLHKPTFPENIFQKYSKRNNFFFHRKFANLYSKLARAMFKFYLK